MNNKSLVRLHPLRIQDADTLANLANNKKVWDNLRDYIPFPYTKEHAVEFIEANLKQTPHHTFGIHYNEKFCGVIGINQMKDVYSHVAEVGYWLGEPYWGNGIMTQALRLMVEYVFKELDIIRIHTGVFEFNVASMAVLEKIGFQKEGSFKLGVRKNGKLVDEIRYALIKPSHQI